MYCFRCGKKLPGREINCPDCDTPQKKRKRRHKRMVLGLFIFLAGAFAGSFFDTYLFKGEAWNYSFFGNFLADSKTTSDVAGEEKSVASPSVKIEVKYTEQSSQQSANKSSSESSSAEIVENKENQSSVSKVEVVPVAETVNVSIEKPKSVEISSNTVAIASENQKIEGVPSEISKILSEAPAEIANDNSAEKVSASVTLPEEISESVTQKKETDEVIIVEGTESEIDTFNEAASISENLYSEAAPIEESVNSNISQNSDGHLVYKGVTLLESVSADSYHGFMSKNGKELVFASNRSAVNGKPVFQCFTKTPEEKAVAKRAFEWNGNVWTPELTPDGNMIVFSSDSTKPEHIFLYDRKSGKSMALTSGTSKNMMPCISPDGKKVAFVSNRNGGKYRIWIMDLYNPNKLVQITKGDVHDREPRWSPDGKNIVFTRIKVNMKDSRIMQINADNPGEPIELVSTPTRNWMPSISPDGKILAFTRSLSEGGSHNTIVLKDLASLKEEILSFPGIFDSYRPVWNSDSSGFIFHVARKNGKSLYQANFKKE